MTENTTLCSITDHIEQCDSVSNIEYIMLAFGISVVCWMLLSSISCTLISRYGKVIHMKYFPKRIKKVKGKRKNQLFFDSNFLILRCKFRYIHLIKNQKSKSKIKNFYNQILSKIFGLKYFLFTLIFSES